MQLPGTLKMGGAQWQLDTTLEAATVLSDNGDYGQTDEAKQRIRIDVGKPSDKVGESLLHEVIHAIHAAYFTPSERPDEAYIKTFTAGLFAVLRDNPLVAQVITRGKLE